MHRVCYTHISIKVNIITTSSLPNIVANIIIGKIVTKMKVKLFMQESPLCDMRAVMMTEIAMFNVT